MPGYLEGWGHSASDIDRWMDAFETAVRYHMYHSLAILAVGVLLLQRSSTALQVAAWAFVLGVLLFSGCLYGWVITAAQHGWMVRIVPIGGSFLIVGWIALAIGAGTFCPKRSTADQA
jgi:uncharacterized membrane protein YgdD (TMEM256/DUF423 family)